MGKQIDNISETKSKYIVCIKDGNKRTFFRYRKKKDMHKFLVDLDKMGVYYAFTDEGRKLVI